MSLSSPDAPLLRLAWIGVLAVIAGCALSPGRAAAQTVVRLEVETAAILSENPFLLAGGDRSAQAIEVTFRPHATWNLAPGTSIDLRGSITDRQYSSRFGNFLTGRAEAEASRRFNEYLTIDGGAFFSRDVSADVLTTAIDSALDLRSIRQGYGARASMIWNFDANTSLRPRIGWEKSDYSGSSVLSGSEITDISAAFSKRVSAVTSVGLRAGAVFSDVGAAANMTSQSLLATVERRFDSSWRLTAQAGIERANTPTETFPGDESLETRVRFSGRGEFCYAPPRSEVCLSAAMQSEPSSFGGLQRQVFFGGTARRDLSERSTARLSAEYRRATAQGPLLQPIDALRGTAAYERQLRKNLTGTAILGYLQRQVFTGERIGAAFLQLRLTYRLDPR